MLLAAVPDLGDDGRARTAVAGEVPNPLDPPPGCAFHPRCPYANERCRRERPVLRADAGRRRGRLPRRRGGRIDSTPVHIAYPRSTVAAADSGARIGYNSALRRQAFRRAPDAVALPPRFNPPFHCASPRSSSPGSSRSSIRPRSARPGKLVGIVGPNGCGKSNVIDAVRWVLGESKASALRGESMQDVIFNGAGERKPVGRASVELFFDNSAGRIGGQWGQYAELSIKRVLTRDGDSSYYINNIPVRRRDIHDLFLGTGLGPRAYAIIEQGMISRVIEAKPEELRVFLEEAAGVSKYKERRKETEGRIADTRENLARVEDIRLELGSQLEKLDAQAKVATEYRELETRLKHVAAAALVLEAAGRGRARASATRRAIATLTVAFEGLQADVRAAEAKQEALRADHYAAGDALHEKQGDVLRGQRRGDAARAAARVRARKRNADLAAGRRS